MKHFTCNFENLIPLVLTKYRGAVLTPIRCGQLVTQYTYYYQVHGLKTTIVVLCHKHTTRVSIDVHWRGDPITPDRRGVKQRFRLYIIIIIIVGVINIVSQAIVGAKVKDRAVNRLATGIYSTPASAVQGRRRVLVMPEIAHGCNIQMNVQRRKPICFSPSPRVILRSPDLETDKHRLLYVE